MMAAVVILFMGCRQLGAVDGPKTPAEYEAAIIEELDAAAGRDETDGRFPPPVRLGLR
jgi:hypothetical protein